MYTVLTRFSAAEKCCILESWSRTSNKTKQPSIQCSIRFHIIGWNANVHIYTAIITQSMTIRQCSYYAWVNTFVVWTGKTPSAYAEHSHRPPMTRQRSKECIGKCSKLLFPMQRVKTTKLLRGIDFLLPCGQWPTYVTVWLCKGIHWRHTLEVYIR